MTIAEQFIIEESEKYKGLTLREKAQKVVREMGETGQIMRVAWLMEIEKALYAQIEECAKVADMESQRLHNLNTALNDPKNDFDCCVGNCNNIADEIRALAGPTEKEKGD